MSDEVVIIEGRRELAIVSPAPVDVVFDDKPLEFRSGWIVVGLFFILFLGFAAFVRLDAAAYAGGQVSVAGSRQAVQHRDGGVVTAINIREGQHVKAGQILIELAGSEVLATERALSAQVIGLESERARLLAERAGMASIPRPLLFSTLTGADLAFANQTLAQQDAEMRARRRAIATQKSVLNQQNAQLAERIQGIGGQIVANRRQSELFEDELVGMRKLAEKGFASVNRVRALERAQAEMSGNNSNLAASSASTREQIGETQMRALSLDTDRLQQISADLRTTEDSLNEALPRWQAARRQLEATRIRATATGQVVGLKVFTVGGVIAPGQSLMEIVPDAAPLVVEAKISPGDADDVHNGQEAELRFPSLHDRNLPPLIGTLTRVSADSFVDDRTGQNYFTGEITVSAEAMKALQGLKDKGRSIKPGLPAEILVPLRKRTLLDYLLEPLDQALWRSGREH